MKNTLRKGGVCTGLLRGHSGRVIPVECSQCRWAGELISRLAEAAWVSRLEQLPCVVSCPSDLCGGPDAAELSCLRQGTASASGGVCL